MAAEDFVLGRVGRAVESEIDQEINDTNKASVGRIRGDGAGLGFLLLLITEVHEDSDSGGDHGHNDVFVAGEFAAIEKDVHDHDWDEFAGLAEDHGGVGYVGEGGKAKWSGRGNKDRTLEVSNEKGSRGIADCGVLMVFPVSVGLCVSVGRRLCWFRVDEPE